MTYLVTGATGYIGEQLTQRLIQEGHTVHALYRSETKAVGLQQKGAFLFKGDLLDRSSLDAAAKGCDAIFHVAAFAKPWDKDPQTFYRYNVEGSKNVFDAAQKAGTRKVVFTSTAGVISPSDGKPSDETTPRKLDYFTDYERSKAQAEALCAQYIRAGMEIVTVNPTRVYGPGLLSDSNGVTRMVKLYLEGKFRLLPGNGKSVGNYVFVEDVIDGHLRAMQRGSNGERYILGGDNLSFLDFFDRLARLTGREMRMIKVPIPLMNFVAKMMEIRANLTGAPPLLTPPWVKKYLYNWELSSQKAQQELGYQPTPVEHGLEKTVRWILNENV
jgi:farnesol dehydrogenase